MAEILYYQEQAQAARGRYDKPPRWRDCQLCGLSKAFWIGDKPPPVYFCNDEHRAIQAQYDAAESVQEALADIGRQLTAALEAAADRIVRAYGRTIKK